MKNKWFEVKNQTENSSDLYFYGDIVSSEWQKWDDADTSATDVKDYLNSVNENTKLNIYINSAGGVVTTGMAIYNMLKRHKGHKTAYIDGIGASIASIIPFAADKIVMPKSSYLMVHLPWVGTVGNKHDLARALNTLETIESNMMEIYYENLRKESDKETIKNLVYGETWLTGEEASNLFNIELIDGIQATACQSNLYKNYKFIPNEIKLPEDLPINQNKEQSKSQDKDIEKLKIQNELDLLTL